MSDREFADVLLKRAQDIIAEVARDLRSPDSSDGKMAPHVAFDKVAKLSRVAGKLEALSAVAASSLR